MKKKINWNCKEKSWTRKPRYWNIKKSKNFDINISFEKEKKQERENLIIEKITEKLPPDNDDIYVTYNSEDNSYELKTENEKDEKEYINGLLALNKKIKKTKNKKIKRDLKQVKKGIYWIVRKEIWRNRAG